MTNNNNKNPLCPSPEFTELMRVVGRNTATLSARDPLTASEVACIRELLRDRPDVTFTLMQLFGLYWEFVRSPRRLGLRFRRAVRTGALPDVYLDPFQTGQIKRYRVSRASAPAPDVVAAAEMTH
jgi:hypothetical protein